MKKLFRLLALAAGLWPGLVFAETSLDLPGLGALDLSNFVANAGAMTALQIGKTPANWSGVSERLFWYPNDPSAANPAENAWVGLEASLLWKTTGADAGKPSGLAAWIGFRADTLGAKILGHAPILGHLKIPSIEVGPFWAYLTNERKGIAGVALAKHF